MAKKPALLWYPGDWLKDQAVRKCSLAAKGAWRELLDLMHADDRDCLSGTVAEFARLLSTTEAEAAAVLTELVANEVCDIDDMPRVTFPSRVTERDLKVTVVSRRLRRERISRESHALRQEKYRKSKSSDAEVTFPSSSSSSSSGAKEAKNRPNTEYKKNKKDSPEAPKAEPSVPRISADERRKVAAALIVDAYKDTVGRAGDDTYSLSKGYAAKLLKKHSAETLARCVERYASQCRSLNTNPDYRISARAFFGPQARYEAYTAEDWTLPVKGDSDGASWNRAGKGAIPTRHFAGASDPARISQIAAAEAADRARAHGNAPERGSSAAAVAGGDEPPGPVGKGTNPF